VNTLGDYGYSETEGNNVRYTYAKCSRCNILVSISAREVRCPECGQDVGLVNSVEKIPGYAFIAPYRSKLFSQISTYGTWGMKTYIYLEDCTAEELLYMESVRV
jgi:hypothetical protein